VRERKVTRTMSWNLNKPTLRTGRGKTRESLTDDLQDKRMGGCGDSTSLKKKKGNGWKGKSYYILPES